jgi:hypothetical protein
MASYHFEIKSGKKGVAAEHARYIIREGKYSDREDLLATGCGNIPGWAETDPLAFWRAADKFERANGATYREMVIALPNELNTEQNVALIKKLIEGLVGNKPYQYALHAPGANLGEGTNTHVHLMTSDRLPDEIERSPELTFKRNNPIFPERGGCRKDSGGKTSMQLRDDVTAKRKMVADIQNAMLEEIGSDTRVDHRSHRARGMDSQPERHLGQAHIKGMSAEDRAAYVAGRTKD